ncbi:hypothetical protein VTK73DRAFT_5979 [Phialemonium thermophilum]|uniref:Uncharacterized protein n=1 Tax=Phialemonium thermophilum TaxID=223376 RepID=A0ABR3WKY8_9PEZI
MGSTLLPLSHARRVHVPPPKIWRRQAARRSPRFDTAESVIGRVTTSADKGFLVSRTGWGGSEGGKMKPDFLLCSRRRVKGPGHVGYHVASR